MNPRVTRVRRYRTRIATIALFGDVQCWPHSYDDAMRLNQSLKTVSFVTVPDAMVWMVI